MRNSINTGRYHKFSINPADGFHLNLDRLEFKVLRRNSGPPNWALRTDAEGFTTDFHTWTNPGSDNGNFHSLNINLSSLSPVRSGESLEFRFYA